MTRTKRTVVGALAIVLAAAPVASAVAGGYGPHHGNRHYYGHRHYGNPLYPVGALAAAVVGTAAAIVTLPFAVLGAAAAQVPPAYYPPAPAPRNYYPQQGSFTPAPGYSQGSQAYGAPQAYYPPPPATNSYAAPPQQYSYSYPQRAPSESPRYPQYGDFDDYRGPAANNGYYRQDVPPGGGSYPPRSGAYVSPYAEPYSNNSPNQR